MADFTMCENHKCPIADYCWRYGAPPNVPIQAYDVFVFDEGTFEEEGKGCEMFMGYPE